MQTASVFSQNKSKKPKQTSWTEQIKDDKKSLPAQDLAYKNLFYDALRLKIIGAMDSSAMLLESCVAKNPKDDAACYVLAEYYAGKNRMSTGLKYAQQAHSVDPKNKWYIELLAIINQNLGNFEDAEKYFGELLETEQHNIDWLYGYSQAQLYNGKIKEAIVTYNKMIEEVGPTPELVKRKVDLMKDQKQDEAIVQELTALIKEYPSENADFASILVDYYQQKGEKEKAKQLLDQLIQEYPNNGMYQLNLSNYYSQIGDEANMYKYLKLAFANKEVELDTKIKMLIYLHDNQAKVDSNVFELLNSLEKNYPESAKVYAIKGDFMLKSEQKQQALNAFKNALKYDQSKFTIWNEVLVLQYETKAYDSLYAYGQKALEYFPSYANLYLLVGIGAFQIKQYDEAASYFAQGKNYTVNDKKMTAEFEFQLGNVASKQNKTAEAITHYDKALELDANNPLYMNNYAYFLANQNTNLERALSLSETATLMYSDVATYLDTRAWVLFKLKRYDEAKQWIQKALAKAPQDAEINEHYGDILYFLGEKENALKYWKIAYESNKENSSLQHKIATKEYHE